MHHAGSSSSKKSRQEVDRNLNPERSMVSMVSMVRTRVDSEEGSTRGAFYQHGQGRPATSKKTTKRNRKKRAKKLQPPLQQLSTNTTTTDQDRPFQFAYYAGANRRMSGTLQGPRRQSIDAFDNHHSTPRSSPRVSFHQPFYDTQQQHAISLFSAMAQQDHVREFPHMQGYGAMETPISPTTTQPVPPHVKLKLQPTHSLDSVQYTTSLWDKIAAFLDPTEWLLADLKHDQHTGEPYFDECSEWNMAGWIRHLFYNPEVPEFTSLQQFSWAVILGVVMGFYTALWKGVIESCVQFVWNTVPSQLFLWGVFTDLHGHLPLPHYMWITPTIFGGALSYVSVRLPTKIPGQNEWIHAVHTRGVQDHQTFWALFGLSTAGMASGLSLGPELPLVLTAGMFGSYIGVLCKQSMLQARVMNLTAASAAVGGFFGFPMAGALFVLEIPHRMGLQYFEALSPATISSIVAVLVNRIVTGDEVTGYYRYPFLTDTLPSHIFSSAIVYGIYGGGIGVAYVKGVLKLKHFVHSAFSSSANIPAKVVEPTNDTHVDVALETEIFEDEEATPLFNRPGLVHHQASSRFIDPVVAWMQRMLTFKIADEPNRAAAAGALAGFLVGMICMFVPHVMFWGEAQLQTMIDKGRSPLPIFGRKGTPSAGLTAYGLCITDFDDEQANTTGYSMSCSALITVSKIAVTGLSLGTGIIGGHFWGPLFTGCIATHFFTDFVNLVSRHIGFGAHLSAFPCVAILCVMGASHVVTYRAHLAIMLILTLTISAFDNGSSAGNAGGDYSAVFPLLVVSVFVALMLYRRTFFYDAQRSRGDIMAIGEVLCEPNKEGAPLVMDYEYTRSFDEKDGDGFDSGVESDSTLDTSPTRHEAPGPNHSHHITQDDIERVFMSRPSTTSVDYDLTESSDGLGTMTSHNRAPNRRRSKSGDAISSVSSRFADFCFDRVTNANEATTSNEGDTPSSRLDELLARPMDAPLGRTKTTPHRRIQSASDVQGKSEGHRRTPSSTSSKGELGTHHSSEGLVQVTTYGEISDYQPSLMDQARMRASSSVGMTHRRLPSLTSRHTRMNSDASSAHVRSDTSSSLASVALLLANSDDTGALPQDEIERNFSSVLLSNRGHRRRQSRGSSNHG